MLQDWFAYRRDQLKVPARRGFDQTLRAIEYGLPLPKDVPATLQQCAWSSPIRYTPKA